MTIYAIGTPGLPVRVLLETDDVRQVLHNIGEGEIVVQTDERPSGGCILISADGDALEVVAPALFERRRARWQEARFYREATAASGCMTPLGRVDTDDASRQKITGAVVMAMASVAGGPPFEPIDWTMSDNGVVTHDAAAMMAMGVAVGRFVDACQQAGVAIRDAINASDEPEAIDIHAGYPATGDEP